MRQFGQKNARIGNLSFEAKLLYSAFALFSIAGLIVSLIYYEAILGSSFSDGAADYYAGSDQSLQDDNPVGDDSGPQIDLGEEEDSSAPLAPLTVRVSIRKLLEVSHFHLFTVPVFLLIIGHLFMLCGTGRGFRLTLLGVSIFSTALHLAAPWLIHALGRGLAWTMPVSGTLMGVSMLLMTIWPLWAMWSPRSSTP